VRERRSKKGGTRRRKGRKAEGQLRGSTRRKQGRRTTDGEEAETVVALAGTRSSRWSQTSSGSQTLPAKAAREGRKMSSSRRERKTQKLIPPSPSPSLPPSVGNWYSLLSQRTRCPSPRVRRPQMPDLRLNFLRHDVFDRLVLDSFLLPVQPRSEMTVPRHPRPSRRKHLASLGEDRIERGYCEFVGGNRWRRVVDEGRSRWKRSDPTLRMKELFEFGRFRLFRDVTDGTTGEGDCGRGRGRGRARG